MSLSINSSFNSLKSLLVYSKTLLMCSATSFLTAFLRILFCFPYYDSEFIFLVTVSMRGQRTLYVTVGWYSTSTLTIWMCEFVVLVLVMASFVLGSWSDSVFVTLQKMVTTILRIITVCQHFLGSVRSLFVETVTLVRPELVMVLFDYMQLTVRPMTSNPFITCHW